MMVFSSPRAQIVASCLVLITLAVAPERRSAWHCLRRTLRALLLGPS